MSYATISNWTATEWTDEIVALANDKFIPMIISAGASSVQIVRTGDLTFCVVTQYENETAATAAQAKIAVIRAKAASDLPMQMESAHAGAVIAGSQRPYW